MNSSQLEINRKNSVYDLTTSNDHLFIPDFRNNKVILYGLPDGNIHSTFSVHMPHGIAVDQTRIIYICTHRQNSIVVIKDDIARCNESALFDRPVSIAVQDDYILIANWGAGDNGNLIFSYDCLNSFHQFTGKWIKSKPHAVRINDRSEIMVVYRQSPGIVVYDINGKITKQRVFSDDFDPLSIVEYKSGYLVPNSTDGHIHYFDSSLNDLTIFYGGGHHATNLAIWNNLLLISEEKANRILAVNLEDIDNILS
jgi:hypothetical protein